MGDLETEEEALTMRNTEKHRRTCQGAGTQAKRERRWQRQWSPRAGGRGRLTSGESIFHLLPLPALCLLL